MNHRMRFAFAKLVLLGAAFWSAASAAQEGVARCAKLEKADERLICYDDLARATESPSGLPVDPSPTPSHLTEDWKLGSKQGGVRRLTDILVYRPNYIVSRWTSNPNEQPTSPAAGRSSLEQQDLDHHELKFQVSLKTELLSRQFFDDIGVTPVLGYVGVNSVRLWFGYTHKVNWQMYNARNSRPFRETNYEPEGILTFGTGNEGNGFKLVNLGLSHQSNGRRESDSRGWNRLYLQGGWEWDRLSVLARAWQRIPESVQDDDNPDIKNYLGRGEVVARYQTPGGYVTSVLVRHTLRTTPNRGFLQADWATPVLTSLGAARLHLQVSSGYGETLIDYNHKQTTIGVGVSFGDW
jgi:phospholipase A1/A2